MMGTGPFAVPTFQKLVTQSDHDVVALVTRPVPPTKGRRKSPANPMRDAAIELGVDTFEPENINAADAVQRLVEYNAAISVVCDYGQILKPPALAATRLGGINLHGSLLPSYRGAAPVQWALYHGESITGISVILMTPGLDAGPILEMVETPINEADDGAILEARLANLGSDAVLRTLERLNEWDGSSPLGIPQDESRISKAPRITKQMGLIDWNRSAQQIRNQIQAFKPWPGSFTFLPTATGKNLRVIIDQVSIHELDLDGHSAASGTILSVSPEQLLIKTSTQALSIERLQPAGKRTMDIAEFLRGHSMQTGRMLSNAE